MGTADDVAELTARFEHFADTSTRHTPLYAAITRRVAGEADVAALLLHAEAGQRIPVLLLAAVHDLLLSGLDHPLAACYPTVVDEPTGAPHEAADHFVDLCRRHHDLVVALVASRSTQTNEIGRSAALRPTFGHLTRRHGPLGLVEVGASAGLNLWFDRYHVTYELDGASRAAGPDTSPVRLRCRLVDDADLPLDPDPTIASRVGLDRSPIELVDPNQDRWLLACTWPDELERFRRLQAAILLARAEPSPVVRGDAVDDLAPLVLGVAARAHPVVFHSWVLSYLDEDRQRAFAAEVARLGRLRPLSYVWLESRDLVPGLPAPEAAAEREGATEVVLVEHGGGDLTPRRLAEMHPHGRWLRWQAPTPSPAPIRGEPGLTAAQQSALDHVRRTARRAGPSARIRTAAVLAQAGMTTGDDLAHAALAHGRVGLNFHPDRIAADGRTVAAALLDDGVYRNQFETRISNGGLSAHPGGDRDRWEAELFGGAYQRRGAGPVDRPKYGGLDLMGHPDGPCPRFGSCHLRLRAEVLERTTFCFGDSHVGPTDVGTADAFDGVLAALLEQADRHGSVLGRPMGVAGLVDHLRRRPDRGRTNGRALDDYVEAQVHGPVRLRPDADALVADPSFRGTDIGRALGHLAERYDLELSWHEGFELDADEVPDELRGPAVPVVARRIAEMFGDGSTVLHAERLGVAARAVVSEPHRWVSWGPTPEVLQQIKQLWHVLVVLGRPAV